MAALNRTRFSSVWTWVRTLHPRFQIQETLHAQVLVMFWTVFGGAGDLDQVAVEEACEGTFVDLKKSFFLLRRSEAPLLAKVQSKL